MLGCSLVLSSALVGMPASAPKAVPVGQNAALRYWMAFALMDNPPAGDVATRIARAGEADAPLDADLAAIVARNHEALVTMHRGTRLAACDWGYDYELQAEAPIANLPRARALSGLNVLHGLRLMQEGRSREAADAWLAGVRFSRDIAADAPWLGALTAARSVSAHLRALQRAVAQKKLDHAARADVEREIGALPDAMFDWSVPARLESEGTSAIAAQIEKAADPLVLLARYFAVEGKDDASRRAEAARAWGVEDSSNVQAIRAAARRARLLNDDLRPRLVAAFQSPWDQAAAVLRELDARATAEPALAPVWTGAERMNEQRGQVVKLRSELLAALRTR